MSEIVFIGLGLHDENDMTLRAVEEAKKCDILFAEFYTSALKGTTIERIRKLLGKDITVLERLDVENRDTILKTAAFRRVGFLVVGDPMTATTHIELRLRAVKQGIPTRVIHGVSILTAAAGLLGLQSYKFGRTVTIPFLEEGFKPTSPYEMISQNNHAGLHTLVLLDLKEGGRFMTATEAMMYLAQLESEMKFGVLAPESLICVLARVGSPNPLILAGRMKEMMVKDFGDTLHCLVVPGRLHFTEREALVTLAGAPPDI